MKKIQILTGLAVLSGFALLSACGGGISVGDATGAGANVNYNCSNATYGNGTIMSYSDAAAPIRYCNEKAPGPERVACSQATTCTKA